MKKITIIALLFLTIFSSCKKDPEQQKETTITIVLRDGLNNNERISNFTIYAIDAQNWNAMGADSYFSARKQIVTDSNGEAKFLMDEMPGIFFGDKTQETYYFLVRYSRNNNNYYNYLGITFNEHDQLIKDLIMTH